jgi:hypothetical protein
MEKWADEEGTTANLAAFLVEQAVRAKYPHDCPTREEQVTEKSEP